jgi:hypothetical protein
VHSERIDYLPFFLRRLPRIVLVERLLRPTRRLWQLRPLPNMCQKSDVRLYQRDRVDVLCTWWHRHVAHDTGSWKFHRTAILTGNRQTNCIDSLLATQTWAPGAWSCVCLIKFLAWVGDFYEHESIEQKMRHSHHLCHMMEIEKEFSTKYFTTRPRARGPCWKTSKMTAKPTDNNHTSSIDWNNITRSNKEAIKLWQCSNGDDNNNNINTRSSDRCVRGNIWGRVIFSISPAREERARCHHTCGSAISEMDLSNSKC